MKHVICLFLVVMLAVPFQQANAASRASNSITLTASQVHSAVDIEAAIQSTTAGGSRSGTVILDGREGAFRYSGEDRSINLFVSNLVLRGINLATIQNCEDGLYFDDFPLKNILVETITFQCSKGGVMAAGTFQNVTLRNNLFQTGNQGIGIQGPSSLWVITDNLIQAGADGIRISGASQMIIANNHLSGFIGIVLLQSGQFQVRHNAIQASYQGVLLGQETWTSMVQANTILGVSASGVALEPNVSQNLVVANRVLCAPGSACLTVDASPEAVKANTIVGNRP